MKQFYIGSLCLIILLIFSFQSKSRYLSNTLPIDVMRDKVGIDNKLKGKSNKNKRRELAVKNEDKRGYANTFLASLPLKTITPKPLNTQLGHLVGPDPFMFTIVASKESVAIGEEFELTVQVSWVDFGINNGVRFLPEWYKYTLKVVMPEGFVQTGGNYEDYCTALVNAENPTATFTIKGHFEFEPKEPTFKVLRGFEGANEKSEFIWKGEKRINHILPKKEIKIFTNESLKIQDNIISSIDGQSKLVSSNPCEEIIIQEDANSILNPGKGVVPTKWVNDLGKYLLVDIWKSNQIPSGLSTKKIPLSQDGGNVVGFKSWGEYEGESAIETQSVYPFEANKDYYIKFEQASFRPENSNNYNRGYFEIKINDKIFYSTLATDDIFKEETIGPFRFETNINTTILIKAKIELEAAQYYETYLLLDNFRIFAKTTPIPTLTPTRITESSSIKIIASGCTNGTVAWDNGSTGNTITVTPDVTTDYKAKCTINNCESDWSSPIRISVCNVPKPVVSGTTTINIKESTNISASGCTNGTITWDNGSTGNTITISPLVKTIYKAKCKIDNNCESDWSDGITITVCDVVVPGVNTPVTYVKDAQAIALTATTSTNGSLRWYNSAEQLLPAAPTPNTSSVGSTNYYLSQILNGCESKKAIITVNVGSLPPLSVPTISKTDNPCLVTLTANTSESGVNYIWTYSTDGVVYGVINGVTSSTYTTSNIGFYKVTISKENYSSATSTPINIITISKTDSPISQGSTTINRGESTTISASGCNSGTISWYNALNVSYIIGNGLSLVVTPSVTTTYNAKCTIDGCGSDLSSPVEITVLQSCDVTKPEIVTDRKIVNNQYPTTDLTAINCAYTVIWYNNNGIEQKTGLTYNVGAGTYYAKCVNTCANGIKGEINSDNIIITNNEAPCSTSNYWPTITNNSTGQVGDKTFCSNGIVSLSVSGCYDNSKAIWYDTYGNFLANGNTYSSTINSNQTFAVSCENQCNTSERLGWETINFTVIPYDQCISINPQIVNNTPGNVTTFCGSGQFSVSASGCPDGNRVKWWVGNGSTIQGSDYSENITSTTEARFQCISPVTGNLIGPQRAITFTVNSYSACNYAPAIINNTPGKKTVFCTKGWVDLAVTGCPNNNLARWYTDGTELNGGIGAQVRGTITRTSKIGVTCLNPNDNTEFGWNEITFKVDNSGCDPNNPTIINNTTHGYNKFCQKGWVSLEVDGCPDNNKAKWYKNNTFVKQSAIYNEVITQNATYKVTCENPTYESSYSEITFEVLTNGDCYIPSVVNLTPNGQTDFCGSGTLKLMMTGCNTNYPAAYEEHIDGKPSRYLASSLELIDGVNTFLLNYNATESGYIKVICRTSEYEYLFQSQQIVKFNVNPIPSISATNTPACIGTPFSLNAIVPDIPINRGEVKFHWTNVNNTSIGSQKIISLVADNSTPTTYNVKFTNNKGCSATASTTVTNYPKPIVSVSNSSMAQCAGTVLNLNASSTAGSGKATIQVKLDENLTNIDRSIILSITGTMNPTPTSVTITQKGKTNLTCITCLNNTIADGQIIGYRDINQPNQKAIIKIENGCAKAWWYDLNEAVNTDWIPFLKNKRYSDSVMRSCITFNNLNNCSSNQACNQGSNSDITNFTSAGGITSFEINLPSVSGTWTVTKPTGSDNNWLSFVNAPSGAMTFTGGDALKYNWTKGTAFKSTLQNPSIGNIQSNDAGTYKVEVTDVRNCVGSAIVNVVVNPLPDPTVSAASTTTFCQGGSVILSAIFGMNSYQWKKDGVNIAGATNQTYTATTSGVYTVQVTNNNCSNTSTVANGKTVTVNTTPSTPVAVGATICYGSSVSLSATGCTGSGKTLNWFKVTENTPVTMPVNPTVNTDYYAKCVQTANGISCESLKSANVTVVVNSAISIVTQPTNLSICSGGNNILTIVATGSFPTYQWQVSTGSTFTNITGETSSTLTISNATVSMNGYRYRCLVSGSCTSAITSSEAVLTVAPNPTVIATATNLNVSAGQSVTLQASGASSYNWTGPDGFTSSVQNPTISNFNAAKAGFYTVTGLAGSCSANASVGLTINTCAVSAVTFINVCAGQTVDFSASGGDKYNWEGPLGQGFIAYIANPKIYNIKKSQEGTYKVTISKSGTDACTASLDVQVNVADPFGSNPYIIDDTDRSNCAPYLTLKVQGCPTGTTSYKWYDVSPENPEANRNTVLSTTNQLVSTVAWNYPLIKVECITPSITSCPSISVIANILTIKKPSIAIKNIIQPCEYGLSTAAVPIGKVTFEIKNANSLTGYALARSDASIPFSWGTAISAFQGSSGTSGAGGYSYSFMPNSIKQIQERPESELPPKQIKVSETLFNIKNANIPASDTRWRLFLLDNETKCIAYTEEFEVYRPNQAIFTNPVSQDNVVNCFNDLGSAVINLQSNNFLTGNLFEGNKQLFTKIVNNAIQVLDDKDNVIKNVTKTSGVGTDASRNYKINLTGLPASTTIKAYQDACVGPQANATTCEQLPRYKISYLAGDGCTYSSPRFAIQQPDVLELYAGASDPNCYGEKIPSVELIANGGNSGKQFYLVTGTTETKIGDADANGKYIVQASKYGETPPYTFKVKDSKGCNISKDVTKSPLLQFVATAVVSTETPEVATMTFTGGKKPFYYAIVPETQSTPPTQWLSISENSGYVDGDPIDSKAMAPGKYKVYMKYGACEILTSPINITIGTKTVPEPPITPISAICASSVEQIKDQVKCNQPFCDVKWYANATGGDTLRLQEDIVNSMTNIGKKEFYVSTKIQGTDKETSARVKVNLLFIPNATVNAPNLTICEGSAISLANLATINNPTDYALTGVMALEVTNPANKVFDDSNFFPDKSGVYKIKQLYKDNPQSLGCSSSGKDLTLTVIPAPSTPLLSQNEYTFCTNMVATAITPTKSNTSNGLLWIDPNKTIADSYNPITSAVGIKTLQVYELAYKSTTSLTEANACRSLLPLTITLNTVTAANLPVPAIKVGGAVCGTNKVSLEATGCGPYMTVNWLANTASGGAYQSVGTGLTYAASAGITYKASCVVKAESCEGPSSTELAVNTAMTAFNVKITANTPLAEYQTLDLKALASPNATYAWTGPNNFTSTLQNPRIVDLTSAAAGTYTVTATESTCTATSTIVIAINQVADCNIKIKAMSGTTETYKFPSTRSASSSALTLSVVDNVSPAYWNVSPTTYSWKDPEGIISTESTLTATKKGEYTLQITKDGKQCESSVTLNGTPCGDVLAYVCNPNSIAAPPTGVTPLKVLRQGDEIFAGDFKARIISSTGNGTFSGTAGVKIPYLANAEILATFSNLQLNDCYELQSGADNKLITVYNPAAGLIVDADKVVDVVRELGTAIKEAIATSINKDYPYIKKLKEDILKEVETNLPEDLKYKFSSALNDLEQAKKDYDNCAGSSTDNLDVTTCKEEAEKRFKFAQERIKDLEKEKDKLVDTITDIILLAVKQVGNEANSKIPALKTAMETDENSLKNIANTYYAKKTENQNYMIVDFKEFEVPSSLRNTNSIKDLETKYSKYQISDFQYNIQDYAMLVYGKYQTKERTALIGRAIRDNGKTLIAKIAERIATGEQQSTTVTYVKDEIIFFLTQLIANKK